MQRPTDPVWPTALRRGTGVIVLLAFWGGWPDHSLLYGPGWWPDAPPILANRWVFMLLYSALGLMMIIDLVPRLMAALLLVLHHYAFINHELLAYGFDYLCATALYFSAVIPTKPAHGYWLLMVRVSLCIIYAAAGLAKALGPTWWTGEALWKAATLPGFEGPLAPLIHQLSAWALPWKVGGWLVITIEALYGACIWFKRLRPIWLVLTIGLHLAIAFTMGLYAFAAIMIWLNMVAFYIADPITSRLYTMRLFGRRAKPSRYHKQRRNPYPTDV